MPEEVPGFESSNGETPPKIEKCCRANEGGVGMVQLENRMYNLDNLEGQSEAKGQFTEAEALPLGLGLFGIASQVVARCPVGCLSRDRFLGPWLGRGEVDNVTIQPYEVCPPRRLLRDITRHCTRTPNVLRECLWPGAGDSFIDQTYIIPLSGHVPHALDVHPS